jgi:hypothetical protein
LERILRDRDHFTRWKLTQKWLVLFFPTRTFISDRAMRISAQNLMHFLMEIRFEIQGHSTNCIAFLSNLNYPDLVATTQLHLALEQEPC